jgi:hypothetical protein
MQLLRDNGDKVKHWIETLEHPELSARRLAYRRLRELGGEPAAAALAKRFDRAPSTEGLDILRALVAIDSATSRKLFRRVLLSEDYDRLDGLRRREMAGWGARRLGGPDMLEALRSCVERRQGREARVMIYLAVLARETALPTLDRFRKPRWRFTDVDVGEEQQKLDWVAREIRLGRPLDAVDLPPGRLRFE